MGIMDRLKGVQTHNKPPERDLSDVVNKLAEGILHNTLGFMREGHPGPYVSGIKRGSKKSLIIDAAIQRTQERIEEYGLSDRVVYDDDLSRKLNEEQGRGHLIGSRRSGERVFIAFRKVVAADIGTTVLGAEAASELPTDIYSPTDPLH